jgi:hypothetical protein
LVIRTVVQRAKRRSRPLNRFATSPGDKEFDPKPWDVGQFMPNRFGLFDVYGNVAELCTIAAGAERQGPAGPIRAIATIGGSINATTVFDTPCPADDIGGYKYVGFRIVRTLIAKN